MRAWYNENDPYAAAWLGNLIGAGEIADGEVDGRSIVAVSGIDLGRFDQCHFFAGLGGWSHALRLAGWPEDRAVWTGSCPCQPFSGAGKGGGFADERHLWPAWLRLIRQHRPSVIFGEQVEGPAGRAWLDLVFTDLEGIGYACGAVVFPAAGVGALHLRHRTYWVADTMQSGRTERRTVAGDRPTAGSSKSYWVAHDDDPRRQGRLSGRPDQGRQNLARYAGRGGATGGLADPDQGQRGRVAGAEERERDRPAGGRPQGDGGVADDRGAGWPSPVNGFWRDPDWIFCRDNKWRPTQPGIFPLAHGATARVGRLRAYGNAIVPQAAAEFVGAYLDLTGLV